jgi:hypothetical protein
MPARKFDFDDENTIGYLNSQIDKFEHFGEYHLNQGNLTERSLSGQLILLTTVLITVNVLVLGDSSLVSHINSSQKVLLLLAFIFEGLATLAGITNYILLESSYDSWSKIYYRCAQYVASRVYDSADEFTNWLDNEQKDIGRSYSKYALGTQITLILVSMVFYMILLHGVFFPISH